VSARKLAFFSIINKFDYEQSLIMLSVIAFYNVR